MKTCGVCGESKPFSDFNKKGAGHQSRCRPCQKEWYANYYKNSGREKARLAQKRTEQRSAIAQFIREAKSVPCTDCGVSYPYYVMDFDHLGDKEFDISRNGHTGLNKIKREIAKCEVVCSNCHRQRTFDRLDKTV